MSADIAHLIQIRDYETPDEAFIFSSWLNNYRATSQFAKRVRNSVFYFWHHKVVTRILARLTTRIYVAVSPDAPDVILGWICVEASTVKIPDFKDHNRVLHYIFVKPEFRRFGIAKKLFEAAHLTQDTKAYFTHWTHPVEPFLIKFPRFIYDPYRL